MLADDAGAFAAGVGALGDLTLLVVHGGPLRVLAGGRAEDDVGAVARGARATADVAAEAHDGSVLFRW